MKPMVFSGSTNPILAKKFASLSNGTLGKLETVTFANSEIKVRIMSNVENQETVIVHSIANPANRSLVELLFMVDAIKRQNAKSVTAIIPYFGYARQNIQHLPGECVSLNVIVKTLEALKVSKVITVDIHDEASSGIFSIPFQNLSALPFLAKELKKNLKISANNEQDYVIASPDQGGVERARIFASNFYEKKNYPETVVVEKKRDLDKIHQSKAIAIFGEVRNKQVILVDDVSTSGKTIVNAAKLCLQAKAKKVLAVVVHADLAIGVAKLLQQSSLEAFFTTNTIEQTVEDLKPYPKIKVIDIAKVLAP